MKFAVALVMVMLADPALAQEPMSGAEFDTYTTGKTLHYGTEGRIYGGEDYLPGRKVRWSFLDGKCLDGEWYAENEQICFVYVDDPEPICWVFYETPEGPAAHLGGDQSQALYEIGEASEPLFCLGPEVGA
jgi:hypothetical protein